MSCTCEKVLYKQYVSNIGLYSSEYSNSKDGPQAYGAINIIGTHHTSSSNFSSSPWGFSLFEFDNWWLTCPSAPKPLPDRQPPRTSALAFIDLMFDLDVLPYSVELYSNHHRGEVVRIWALDCNNRWWLLWEHSEEDDYVWRMNTFSIKLRRIPALVSCLRVEMDYTKIKYHSALHSVMLSGLPACCLPLESVRASAENTVATDRTLHNDTRTLHNDTAAETATSNETVGTLAIENNGNISADNTGNKNESNLPMAETMNPFIYANIREELSCLNICNKVIMHGLQNTTRTRDDILVQGPNKLDNHLITDLMNMFSCNDGHNTNRSDEESNASEPQRNVVTPVYPLHQESTKSIIMEDNYQESGGYFAILPPEVSLRILGLLDLRCLCRVAQTCRALNSLAYHPHLYKHITLKDWWSVIDDNALTSLMLRLTRGSVSNDDSSELLCDLTVGTDPSGHEGKQEIRVTEHQVESEAASNGQYVPSSAEVGSSVAAYADNEPDSSTARAVTTNYGGSWEVETFADAASDHNLSVTANCRMSDTSSIIECMPLGSSLVALDLSWCGSYGAIIPSTFLEFIHKCGERLSILRLSCCDFIDNYCLYMIANVCRDLTELNVSRCYQLDFLGLGELKKLSLLTRLDVSHTKLLTETTHVLLQNTHHLRHLNINGCTELNMDETCLALSHFCPELVSLTAWKTLGMTYRGLRALASLSLLQDLDLGWVFARGSRLEGAVIDLVKNCRSLVRLRLTACRFLADNDILAIADFCPHLQQLDVVGNTNLSPESINSVLVQCTQLLMLDVSYCSKINSNVCDYWGRRYPRVNILCYSI